MARSKTFDLNSDHEERDYSPAGKTVGDKWREADEMGSYALVQGSDDGDSPVSHRLANLVESGGDSETDEFATETQGKYWKTGAIERVGDNARPKPTGYYDTHQVKAESPTGKFGKPGGSGQRSGS